MTIIIILLAFGVGTFVLCEQLSVRRAWMQRGIGTRLVAAVQADLGRARSG